MTAPDAGTPAETPAASTPDAPPAALPVSSRWLAFRAAFVREYLTIDPRSLGLGRIALAIILLFDLVHRASGGITLWYSNLGLMPNHTLLWRPPTQWMFSLFFMASWPDEATLGFVLCGLIYVGLLVGWRTRAMQVLSLIAVMSLHSRTTFLENGGDWTLGELALWTVFLPLGRRFSVDAVLGSMRRRRFTETTAADLNAPESRAADVTPVVSLAVLAVVLQLANAYLFNALHKGGATWRTGSAVHYVLYQDRMVTWFGVWLRPYMALWLSRILSWSALATEAVLPVLLLAPLNLRVSRRMAIFAIIGLHLGFQCFINLGVFSFAMMAFTPYLISRADWEWLHARATRRGGKLVVYFDAGCGVCFQIARLLCRLDRFDRLRFVSNADRGRLPRGVDDKLLEKTIVAHEEGGEEGGAPARLWTRADAMARIFRALPLGAFWSWPLRLPGLRQLANVIYDAFARRRQTVSIWLGLAACGVPGAPPPVVPPPPEPTPFAQGFRRVVTGLRELVVFLFIVTLVSETLFINAAVPQLLKHKQPTWIMEMVAYPRMIQAWSMFASDAPMTDETVVVDAVTADGRHVDPYNEISSRYPTPGLDQIQTRLDNDSFFFNYSARIPYKGEYWTALEEWILRYPQRTGRPEDQIVKFDAWIIEDDSPPAGETQARNLRKHIFLSYPRK